ncbi:hypothetical protein [Oceanirhabdus seepicola]|uniref:FERM domain-containing protein n=1 Tax=Oceanirhabdus seepicola TaxID=2828781 RepID=A0A9J6P5E5_9CLOT|nr:hypothetical protein [Oceanirhabdus seepicola]MCM1991484.1 hypothetical protein [Oceanirhabdus seepicola]
MKFRFKKKSKFKNTTDNRLEYAAECEKEFRNDGSFYYYYLNVYNKI